MGEFKQVSDNYQLETWDHVLDPSTPGAIPRVVTESVVDAVGRFISADTSPSELQGYQSVLSEILLEQLPEDLRSSAQAMVDTIAVRLANANNDRVSVAVPRQSTTLSEEPMSAITKDLPEVRQILADAAERLLSEVVARTQRDRLMQHVDRLTQSLPESIKPKMRELLAEATSIADANRRFSTLSTMINEAAPAAAVVTEGTTKTTTGVVTEGAKPAGAAAVNKKPFTDGALPKPGAVQETLNESTTDSGRAAQPINESTQITRGLVRRLNLVHPSAAAAR